MHRCYAYAFFPYGHFIMKPLFHISFNKALPSFLYPRQPSGLYNPDKLDQVPKESIYSENLPPRISFSPSATECFRAIWPNIHKYFTRHKYPHMDMYVYALVKGNEKTMFTPDQLTKDQKLWDAFFTQEHCFLTKVKVEKVAKIRVFNPMNGGQVLDPKYEHKLKNGVMTPLIHPHNNPDYKLTTASPDPLIKVIRIYNPSRPLVIKPL